MTAPQIKVKIQRRPTLKLKVLPKFPASVTVSSPLTLDRTGGNLGFGLSVTDLRTSLDPLYATQAALDLKVSSSILTTRGDLFMRGVAVIGRLALGAADYTLVSDGTDAVWTLRRKVLAANLALYVRADGSDSNTGLADTAGGAFLTPQTAASYVLNKLDLNGFNVTIRLTGAFTSGMTLYGSPVGAGTITVETTATTTITTTDANGIAASYGGHVVVNGGGFLTMRTLTASSLSPSALAAFAYGKIDFSGIVFGPSVGAHIQAGWSLDQSTAPSYPGPGVITATGNYSIATGANLSHMHVTAAGSAININSGVTVTLTGTPSFSAYFVGVRTGGLVYANGTYSGAATGQRFFTHQKTMLQVPAGAGLSYFPGSVAGVNRGGGLYVESDDAASYFGIGTLDVGGSTAVPDSPLTINTNTAASVAPTITAQAHIVAANGVNANVALDAFGAVQNQFTGRLAKGTLASKTGVVNADTLVQLGGEGWDTAAYAAGPTVRCRVTETWSATAHGCEWAFRTVPNTTTTPADALVVRNSGGVTVGASATDQGINTLNVAGAIHATGGQIVFPATQAASANANTLDDYEEGTFTPGIAFGGASVGVTYTTQDGTYTKIGNRVFYEALIILSARGSSTGTAKMTGLPFTVGKQAQVACFINSGVAAVATMTTGSSVVSTTTSSFQRLAAGTVTDCPETDFSNTTSMRVAGVYPI